VATSISFIDALRAELPDGRATTDPDHLERCSADWSWPALYARANGTSARPDVVVRAASDEEIAVTLRLATENGVTVVPRGGGSGVMGAAVPHHGGIVLDLAEMNRVVEIDEESMTATVEAGHNGREFEQLLNARGLSFPHFPASAEWASVGGYVAGRGSGVLSTRYGKIEDQVLSLRVVLANGDIIDTVPLSRHAVGPELTQLFVGSEGTLGVITRVRVKVMPIPEHRRFEAFSIPTLRAAVDALRHALQRGIRPSVVRLYDVDASAGSLTGVVGQELRTPTLLLVFEGQPGVADAEADVTLQLLSERGGSPLDSALCERWWNRRYDFYYPPHYPQLPAMWGTIDAVASYRHVLDVYEAVRDAVGTRFAGSGLTLRTHFSHWYEWGSMVYPRFVLPDIAVLDDPLAVYKQIWGAGVEAILGAGGLINDHHGIGSTLAPYVQRQWGPAFGTLLDVKRCLDPANVLNPGKLGFPLDRPGANGRRG